MKKCYLRDKDHHPITLIYYEIVGGVITYGMSTRHPVDANDKERGHLIAEGRVKSRRARTVFQRHTDPIVDIADDIHRDGTRRELWHMNWYKAASQYLTVAPDRGFLPGELPEQKTAEACLDCDGLSKQAHERQEQLE